MEQFIGNAVPVNLARFVGECVMIYEANEVIGINSNDINLEQRIKQYI